MYELLNILSPISLSCYHWIINILLSTRAKNRHFRDALTRLCIPVLLYSACATLGKLTSQNTGYRTNNAHSEGLFRRSNKKAYRKRLAQSLGNIFKSISLGSRVGTLYLPQPNSTQHCLQHG